MLKLKLQYFGNLMRRADSFERTLILGKIEGRRRMGWQRMRDSWMASPTQWTWVWVNSGSWWWQGGLSRQWHPTPVLLPAKSHGRRRLVGCSPWGCKVRHGWATEQQQHDYTVEVTSRFKGFDLIDRLPEELWTEVCNIVQEAVTKTIPKKKKCKKAKWLSEEALQRAEKRREAKGKGEKERYTHLNAEFQRVARRGKKPSSAINTKK